MGIPLDTRQIQSRADAMPSAGPSTGLLENTFSAFDQFSRENWVTSEGNQWQQEWDQQRQLAEKHGVKTVENFNMPADPGAVTWMQAHPGHALPEYWHDQRDQQFAELKQRFPDEGFKSNIEMFDGMTQRLAAERGGAANIRARASGAGQFGAFMGDMAGAVSDPVVALTLPFGAAEGASVLRAAVTEGVIAATTEASIQPQIAKFRAAIGNPQAEGEAMQNIMMAGGGAAGFVAAIRAIPIGYRALAETYRQQVASGRIKPTVQEQAALGLLERHANESEVNPFNRSLEGATEAHAANLRKADEAAAEGGIVTGKDLQTPVTRADQPGELLERRSNPQKRRQIEDLQARVADLTAKIDRGEATPAELKTALKDLTTALHTSEKAPALQNERAFHNFMGGKTDQPVLFFDLDNFKRVNDEHSHDVGDQVIEAVGNLAKEVSDELKIPIFHKSGDEFLGAGATADELNRLGKAVQDRLHNAEIDVRLPDGTLKTLNKEVRLSFGVGHGKTPKNSVDAAEVALHADKQRRKAAGLRTDRPDELPGGQPGHQNPKNQVPETPIVPRETGAANRSTPEAIEARVKAADEGLRAEVDAKLLETPDLKVFGAERIGDDGEISISTVTAKSALEDAAEEERLAAELAGCVAGPATEAAA